MTLSTHINFKEKVDPEKLFGICREIIGIPNDQPFEIETGPNKICPERGEHVTQIRSVPGGFDAMLWLTIAPTGTGDFECGSHYWCEKYPEDGCSCRNWFAQIMLDTAYASISRKNEDCKQLHMRIIQELATNDFRCSEWEDEFTGEWYTKLPYEILTTMSSLVKD